MEEILERTVLKLLKNAGFESVEPLALKKLLRVFDDKITSTLSISSQIAGLACRPSITILDLFGLRRKSCMITLSIPREVYIDCDIRPPFSRNLSVSNLFTLVPLNLVSYPYEIYEEEEEWISPVSTKVDKFIHIYEFMPTFPPIHTFRMTSLKEKTVSNQSSKVKNRLEQSLRTEGNLIKLIKSSGTVPNFINYLYRNKR